MSSKNSQKVLISVISFFIFLLFTFSIAQPEYADLTIKIDVAPNVLNLQNNGQVVTVHTNIAYGIVQASTVYLNNVAISSWKSDLRGNFVAKFNIEEIKNLPLDIGEYNTLTLEGTTTSGEPFSGSQNILVIDNVPKKK